MQGARCVPVPPRPVPVRQPAGPASADRQARRTLRERRSGPLSRKARPVRLRAPWRGQDRPRARPSRRWAAKWSVQKTRWRHPIRTDRQGRSRQSPRCRSAKSSGKRQRAQRRYWRGQHAAALRLRRGRGAPAAVRKACRRREPWHCPAIEATWPRADRSVCFPRPAPPTGCAIAPAPVAALRVAARPRSAAFPPGDRVMPRSRPHRAAIVRSAALRDGCPASPAPDRFEPRSRAVRNMSKPHRRSARDRRPAGSLRWRGIALARHPKDWRPGPRNRARTR